MVTVFTALHHSPEVGSHVDLVFGGQTTQSGLDESIFHSFVFIAGVRPVGYGGKELQERSEEVSVFLTIAVYSVLWQEDDVGPLPGGLHHLLLQHAEVDLHELDGLLEHGGVR